MAFHATAVLTITLLCNIVIFLMMLFLYHTKSISRIVLNTVLVSLLIISIRWLFPTELIIAKTIPIKAGFPRIMDFLWNPIVTLFNCQISPLLLCGIIWAIGFVFLSARSIHAYFRVKNGILLCSRPLHMDIESNSGRVLKNRVIVSSTVNEPIIIGYFRPVIVLPEIELSQAEINIILEHELIHYRKKDLWIHLVITILRILYWWNPFCYIVGDLISELIEVRVDRQVQSKLTKEERIAYLECMLKVANNKKMKFSLAFGKSIRFKNFSSFYNLNRKSSPIFQLFFIMIVVFITMLPFTVIFEPFTPPKENVPVFMGFDCKNAYFIDRLDEYDLFIEDEYVATLNEIPGSLSDISIYE